MKKNIIIILLIFIVPILAYWTVSKKTEAVSAKTVQPSVAVTNTQGKPQVIKFTSTMCRDCQTMNGIFKEIFPKYEGKIVLIQVPVQDKSSFNNAQMKKYNVTLVPTIILINSQGKQVERIEGAVPKDEMDAKLRNLK